MFHWTLLSSKPSISKYKNVVSVGKCWVRRGQYSYKTFRGFMCRMLAFRYGTLDADGLQKNTFLSRYRLIALELLILSRHEVRIIVSPLTVYCHLRPHLHRLKVYQCSQLLRWCEMEEETVKHVLLECKTLSLYTGSSRVWSDIRRDPIGASRGLRTLRYGVLEATGIRDNILLTTTK